MIAEIFPGLSFWLNWMLGVLIIVVVVTLVVAYNVMARKAPPLEYGQRSEEHVLHDYRNYTGIIAALNGVLMIGVVAMRADAPRVGWLLPFGVVVLATITACVALRFITTTHADLRD